MFMKYIDAQLIDLGKDGGAVPDDETSIGVGVHDYMQSSILRLDESSSNCSSEKCKTS